MEATLAESSEIHTTLGVTQRSDLDASLQYAQNVELTSLRKALEALAGRHRADEVLTAVRHFPAREAQWANFPGWVNADLATAYAAKGIRQLYTHQAAAAQTVHAGK